MPSRQPPNQGQLSVWIVGVGKVSVSDRLGSERGRLSRMWMARRWIRLGGERTTAPKSERSCGAADISYSAGGLINAMALRWRTNLGSFG